MDNKISRREFLRRTAVGLGAVTLGQWLSACSPNGSLFVPASTPTFTPAPTATSLPTPTPRPASDLAVARGGNDPEVLVRKAVAAVGGMEHYVPKGSTVVVKPNMCTTAPASQGATTHPVVVATLVKMALEAGAKQVKVLDYPFGGLSTTVYDICGVGPAVKAAGGVMIPITNFKFKKTTLPKGVALKAAEIYEDILNADVLINVPVAKNHMEAFYTLGLKNLMGTVLNREAMHVSLQQSIVDLNTQIRSHLTVIDGIRVMMMGGPTGGSQDYLKPFNTIIASPDIVAADTYALKFFNAPVSRVPYIGLAEKAGLGHSDIQNLKIEELNAA